MKEKLNISKEIIVNNYKSTFYLNNNEKNNKIRK